MARSPIPQIAPGPQGREMGKNFGLIRKNTTKFLQSMHGSYGEVVQYPVPVVAISVNRPDFVDYVLRANARNYSKDTMQYSSLKLVTGEGLLTADGEIWRSHRKVLQPAFHRTTHELVTKAIEDSYEHMAAEWRKNPTQVRNLSDEMQHVTLDVVGRALFGTSLTGNASKIASATLSALEVVVAKARLPLPLPSWLPTYNNIKLRRANKALDGAVRHLLEQPPSHPDAFITLLLEAHAADPERFPISAVRDEIVTFIVAGHETVASALTWSIMLAQANDTDVLAADSAAIFAEALRLYPPAWLITRSAIADDEFDGITIPAGSLIIMSPYLLQRGATWTEPESFHPERFVNPQDQIARADYLPFGLGARMCIGRDMALLEGPQILQKIARDFTITPVSEWEKAGVIQGVTLTPAHPVLFTAAAR